MKRNILSRITDYDSNKIDSPDAKQYNNFLDENFFYKHTTGKEKKIKQVKVFIHI